MRQKIEEYGGSIIETDGKRTIELIDPNDNAKRRFQYRAIEAGIESLVLQANGEPFIDTGSPWEPVDLKAMLRMRGNYHPIIDELGADIIRATRRARGWSVSEMAKHCNVSPRTVEGWEQGRTVPSIVFMLL